MTAPQPQFLWHNAVHEAWGDEKLVFLFLAYEPTYNRDTAIECLQGFLNRLDVHSYQMYELTAPYDILVRAWIPRQMPRHELRQRLKDEDGDITVALTLEVEEIIHHWPWAKSRRAKIGDLRQPTQHVLDRELPVHELETLNALQRVDGRNHRSGEGKATLRKKYKDARILTRPSYRPGIRFLVLVKVRDVDQWGRLQHRICTLLNKARATIRDPSLYRLDDQHQFLIFGQVAQDPGNFHAISKRLVSQINDYAASGGARTYSVFFPIPGFLAFRDELPLPQLTTPTPEIPLEELLQKQEGQRLEIKGSAFTELHKWFTGQSSEPMRSKKPTTDGNNKAVNSLMRAIASMLNSDGGHVVVGALERSKFGDYKRFKELPAAEGKSHYRCCGVEFDYGESDWDEFALLLRKVIETRFEPVPAERSVKIRLAEIGGRDVCIIDVTAPDDWSWVKVGSDDDKSGKKAEGRSRLEPQFFVRVDGSSRRLKGRAIDSFKADYPRRGF